MLKFSHVMGVEDGPCMHGDGLQWKNIYYLAMNLGWHIEEDEALLACAYLLTISLK